MYSNFKEMAHDFNEDYGSGLFYSDEEQENLIGVECPFCCQSIYFDEWDEDEDEDWSWAACPFCGNKGFEDDYDEDHDEEDDEEDDYEYEDEDEEDK